MEEEDEEDEAKRLVASSGSSNEIQYDAQSIASVGSEELQVLQKQHEEQMTLIQQQQVQVAGKIQGLQVAGKIQELQVAAKIQELQVAAKIQELQVAAKIQELQEVVNQLHSKSEGGDGSVKRLTEERGSVVSPRHDVTLSSELKATAPCVMSRGTCAADDRTLFVRPYNTRAVYACGSHVVPVVSPQSPIPPRVPC